MVLVSMRRKDAERPESITELAALTGRANYEIYLLSIIQPLFVCNFYRQQ